MCPHSAPAQDYSSRPVSIRAQSAPWTASTPTASTPTAIATPGRVGTSGLQVYLITVGAGSAVWERFGHSALWLRDSDRGIDIAYNWGIFDFQQPHFITRFLTANTTYTMAGFDAPKLLASYVAANRSVVIQKLHLTAAQSAALLDFVEWNARPENRSYRYDYFRDNCATRIRDVLDMVLGGTLHRTLGPLRTSWTYRSETQRLVADAPLLYSGVTVVLGERADASLSAWDDAFLPERLSAQLDRISLRVSPNHTRRLVETEQFWFRAHRPAETTVPPRELPTYLAIGVGVGMAILLLSGISTRARPTVATTANAALAIIGCTWSVLAGAVGVALVGAWTLTDHVFMYQNENILQFNPLSLALAILLPCYLLRPARQPISRQTTLRTQRRAGRVTLWLSVAVALSALGGLLLKALPSVGQANGEMVALALPIHLAVALAVWRRSGKTWSTAAFARHDRTGEIMPVPVIARWLDRHAKQRQPLCVSLEFPQHATPYPITFV